jgi:hypothetical protein
MAASAGEDQHLDATVERSFPIGDADQVFWLKFAAGQTVCDARVPIRPQSEIRDIAAAMRALMGRAQFALDGPCIGASAHQRRALGSPSPMIVVTSSLTNPRWADPPEPPCASAMISRTTERADTRSASPPSDDSPLESVCLEK